MADQRLELKKSEVIKIIKNSLNNYFAPDIKYDCFADGSYTLPGMDEMKGILNHEMFSIKHPSEQNDGFDCDDFSFILKARFSEANRDHFHLKYPLCVGIIWGEFHWVNGYHSANWFIDNQKHIHLIEPQENKIRDISDCKGNINLIIA